MCLIVPRLGLPERTQECFLHQILRIHLVLHAYVANTINGVHMPRVKLRKCNFVHWHESIPFLFLLAFLATGKFSAVPIRKTIQHAKMLHGERDEKSLYGCTK